LQAGFLSTFRDAGRSLAHNVGSTPARLIALIVAIGFRPCCPTAFLLASSVKARRVERDEFSGRDGPSYETLA